MKHLEAEEVLALYRDRATARSPLQQAQRRMREVYNGDVVFPLPEVGRNEASAVANLVQQGCDQYARRVASVVPSIEVPPVSEATDASKKRATNRKSVLVGWHAEAKLKSRILGRGGRHYFGYGGAAFQVTPGDGMPKWRLRDVPEAFPSEGDPDDCCPADVIHHFTRPLSWLRESYPMELARVFHAKDAKPDTKFSVLEYQSGLQRALVLVGQADQSDWSTYGSTKATFLEDEENRIGRCMTVMPGRVTLDKPLGHFDQVLGMYLTQAELMAMSVIAMRRSIWPRNWVIANANEAPQIISEPDPDEGRPGVIKGGQFEREQLDPSYQAAQVIDRLEAYQREGAGIVSEFSGTSGNNIRTGFRGRQVMGAAIDFTLAEAQEAFAEAIHEADCIAIAVDKEYHNTKKVFSINTRGLKAEVEYTPSALWENDTHTVEFPLTGQDVGDLTVTTGQMVGMGTMSKVTAMQMHPAIADADEEKRRIDQESLEEAWKSSVQTMAANPEGPYQPIHFAQIAKKMAGGMAWFEAVDELQRELQEAQASEPPPTPDGMMMPPEAMPGLSMPGQGAEVSSIPEVPSGMENLTGLMNSLQATGGMA